MDQKEQFKIYLQEMLNEDETMAVGLENEVIYKIDNLTVFGGFEMGIRGVDHAALLMDGVSWADIINWGTLVVPETETYISDHPIQEFENMGFQILPSNENHIISSRKEIDKEINTEEKEQAFNIVDYSEHIMCVLNKFGISVTIDSKESLLDAKQSYLNVAFEQFYEQNKFEEFDHYLAQEKLIVSQYVKNEHKFFLSGENEVLLTKSSKDSGKYQLTFFDDKGAVSDKNLETLSDVTDYLIANNMIPANEEYAQFLSKQGVTRMTQQYNNQGEVTMGYEIKARKTLGGSNYIVSAENFENAQKKIALLEETKDKLMKEIFQLEQKVESTQDKLEHAELEFIDQQSDLYPKVEKLETQRDFLYKKIEDISTSFPEVADYSKAYDELSEFKDKTKLERYNPADSFDKDEWKFIQEKDIARLSIYGSEVSAAFVVNGKVDIPLDRNDIKAELFIESKAYENQDIYPHLFDQTYHNLSVTVTDEKNNQKIMSLTEFENNFKDSIPFFKPNEMDIEKDILSKGALTTDKKLSLNERMDHLTDKNIDLKKKSTEAVKEAER